MFSILLSTPNFISKKMVLAVLVIATSVGPVAFAQRTTTVDAKGTLKTSGNIVTESATAPTTPAPLQGDVWFDTTNNLVKVWEGSVWKTVASTHASDLADNQTIETFTVDDATQVITLGLEDDDETDKTIDLSAAIAAGETDTSLSQDTTTGVITYTAEDGLDDTANVVSTATGNLLSVGADGGAFFNQTTSGVSAGYKAWEFANGDMTTYLTSDLGFSTYTWAAIPFNSTPVLVNSTGNPQKFSFNADGSIGLEAGHVYRISVSLGLISPARSGMRLVEQGNPSNVLANSIDINSSGTLKIETIISPSTTANYNVEFYFSYGSAYILTIEPRYNQILPRATFQIEVLN